MAPAKTQFCLLFVPRQGVTTHLFFWNRKEIGISQVGHKTRTHNGIVPPDGKAPHTLIRGYQSLWELCCLFVFYNLYLDRCQQSTLLNICPVSSYIWILTTNQGSSDRAHKESDLSSWICMGTISCDRTNLTKWIESECGWQPFWTPLPQAAKALQELVKCGCTKSCLGKCSCYKKGLVCTARCKCGGACYG